jgi:hypothetical protein
VIEHLPISKQNALNLNPINVKKYNKKKRKSREIKYNGGSQGLVDLDKFVKGYKPSIIRLISSRNSNCVSFLLLWKPLRETT